MKKILLALAALGEAATGVVLPAYPPIVVRVLFGTEIAGGRDEPHRRHRPDG